MNHDPESALKLLRTGVGEGYPDATFHEGQEEAIRHVVEGKGPLLLVQRTGWGKSLVYFIATRLLRDMGSGPVLLISPLLALMRNQIEAATRMGVRAATINSDNVEEWRKVERRIRENQVDILLISPERLASRMFVGQVLAVIADRISLLVVDEAHCISDWGHDFRPHYRLLARIVKNLTPNLRLLATTATANDRVIKDLESVLGPDLEVRRGDLNRSSITLQTIRLPSKAERLAWLAEQLTALRGHGIIYTLTVRDANQVSDWLKTRGFRVDAYTGKSGARRIELEQALLSNQVKALVATTALGMGFDKPDLDFVIHYQAPGSVIAYYQQVGRAGRAVDAAYGVLLSGIEEIQVANWFIETAFPTDREVSAVLSALEKEPRGLTASELLSRVNIREPRLERTLTLLSLESPSPITSDGSRWQLAPSTLGGDFWDRARRITRLRQKELAQMQDYIRLPFGRHMGFLIDELNGDPALVTEPTLPPLPTAADPDLVMSAERFLRETSLAIEPRRQWPAERMPYYGVSGDIPPALQARPGRALSFWGDVGWGGLVRKGKFLDRQFSDGLVDACTRMVLEWNPEPRPRWVTCVPSLRRPHLVSDFAKRLAAALRLPFHEVFKKTKDRPEQKSMPNSVQQALNVDGSLMISVPALPRGPVLLVDDMVDSRWTLTFCAWLLRMNGSDAVWPLCLAITGGSE